VRWTVGVIADTHALLRPEALAALAGVDRIVHAGDIGSASILHALEAIAPVTAVRGNNDTDPWARDLPDEAVLVVERASIYVLHDLNALAIDPAACGHGVVIAGHSHRPLVQQRGDVLFVNPGSAGPRRFSLPVCVARLVVEGDRVHAAIETLDVAPPARRPAGRAPRSA
jgi:uncharacterized protein